MQGNRGQWLSRRNLVIAAVLLAGTVATACYFSFRRPQPVAMARYVPESALAYLEVDSLPDVADGLTSTRAWRELGSALGLSSQLGQIGLMSDLIGRTGLGPDEAVVAGRAQFAVIVTDVETEAVKADEGPYLHFKPRMALVIETHSRPEVAARLITQRAVLLAQRIYGLGVAQEEQEYQGHRLLVFRGANSDRELVAAAIGSVAVLTNHLAAMRECLDTISGRAGSLSEDPTLARLKPELASNPAVSGFVSAIGVKKLIGLAPAFVASRYQTEPDIVASFANLLEHIADQAVVGLLYAAEFKNGSVVDHYLTALEPGIGEALAAGLKPAPPSSFASPRSIPRAAEEVTLLDVERAGEIPERCLKELAPHVDVVAGVALREFAISLRKQYGIEGAESVGDAIGHEIALVNFGRTEPQAMLLSVKDRDRLAPFIARYLSRGAAGMTSEALGGTEVLSSSNSDGRAAAFIGDFLALATRQQIGRILEAHANGDVIANDPRFEPAISMRPPGAAILSVSSASDRAADFLLGISKLTRVTDGSRELLEREPIRKVIEQLPAAVTFTEFRGYGVYSETRSALGNFTLAGTFLGGAKEE